MADAISRCAENLRVLDAGESSAESVKALLDQRDVIVDGVVQAEGRYRVAADALDAYAKVLDRVQADTLNALYAARSAKADAEEARRAQAYYEDLANEQRQAYDGGTDDGSYARYTRLAGTKAQDALDAQMRIDAHTQIVDQAVADRDAAAQEAISLIEGATASDGLGDSWWDDWGATITKWIAMAAELVAAVAGILALVVGWIPVVGQALAAGPPSIAGVVAATGEQSSMQTIVSVVLAALGCVGLKGVEVDERSWGLLALLGAVSPGAAMLLGAGMASGIVGDGRGDQSWWWSRASRRGARRGRGRGQTTEPSSQGAVNTPGGLGEPVWGTHAPIPPISPWQYQGDTAVEGSGQHNQRAAGLGDYAVHEAATSAADVMAPLWPDASKNLLHFLDNTGTPLNINVDTMLEDLPDFQNDVSDAEQDSVRQALDAARNSGFDAPVTYPFTTDWDVHYAKQSDNANWFYATGGFSYALAGTVTVYPPDDASSGVWRHEVNYEVHVADRYNWDGSKQTQIGPFTVTDAQLQELHRAGIAQEYDLVGCSSVRSGQ